MKAVVQALGMAVQETPEFSRGEYNPSLGFPAPLQEASLALNDTERLSGVISTAQGPAIAYLSNVVRVKDEDFTAEKDNYRQMLTARKRNQIITMFVTKLKLRANLRSDLKGKIRR